MIAMIRRIFNAICHTVSVTIGVLPTSADAAAAVAIQLTAAAVAWTWGAWAEVAAAAAVTSDRQIIGVSLENFVGNPAQGEVQIGTGAGGSETAVITLPITSQYTVLPGGPLIISGTRVAARYRTSTGVADNVSVKLVTKIGA